MRLFLAPVVSNRMCILASSRLKMSRYRRSYLGIGHGSPEPRQMRG
jgi:hypothetical protein